MRPHAILLILLATTVPHVAAAQAPDVNVTITSDNAYGFGYGPLGGLTSYFGGIFNTTAGDIFNCSGGPEVYLVSGALTSDFLYIVGWSDDSVTQGVLGQFAAVGGGTLYTGQGGWEVYATGVDFDGGGGPTVTQITTHIAIANAAAGATGTTSIGWVGTTATTTREGVLVFGEDNTTPSGGTCTNPFPLVCPVSSGQPNAIDGQARWMWYQRPGSTCAFTGGNHREFLIFRIPIDEVITVSVDSEAWGAIKVLYR